MHITIADRRIGPNEPCYIIAEIGVNHNGDVALARKLIDAAVRAGANAVKFQKRKLTELYSQALLDQPRTGEQGLQYIVPLLAEFELSDADFRALRDYAATQDIVFFCTPWDLASLDFLETLDLPAYKIGSPDMTNLPLIDAVARTRKPFLLSTGMSTEEEIRRTIAFLHERESKCALFHCVSTYPAAAEEINLRFMQVLREWSGYPVGYSGHDAGVAISLAAVAMGACMLEKHLTLDRTMRGPDHSASLEPDQFAEQVRLVREVEASLGASHRWMTRGEVLNRRTLAKSLVATTDLGAGTVVTREMISAKSPGLGLSPQRVDELVGRSLERPIRRDEMFLDSDLVDAAAAAHVELFDVGTKWGIVARFTDIDQLVPAFEDKGMSFVEFHVSDRDLDAGVDAFDRQQYPYGMVVHAPEYCHDQLIDLCAADPAQRRMSIERIQKTIDLTRAIAPHFVSLGSEGPKIVMHVGGMSPKPDRYDVAAATGRLLEALRELDTAGVDLLLENLPPFPWYFGGKWFGHVLCDSENTEYVCRESGLGLCFDTSHAALECNRSGEDLVNFARRIAPYVHHLHVSDGAGVSGEGLQIGEGDINFTELLPVLLRNRPTMIPEIWMGHHERGRGFHTALAHLSDLTGKGGALGASRAAPAGVDAFKVSVGDSVYSALRTIDTNRTGIAFVVDDDTRVVGVVTDGDIRHGLVKGFGLHTPVVQIMTRDFVFASAGMNSDGMAERLQGRTRVLPVVDAAGRLVDFVSDTHRPSLGVTDVRDRQH